MSRLRARARMVFLYASFLLGVRILGNGMGVVYEVACG